MQLISDVFTFREHDLTPRSGGLLDQDPRWVEMLAIVDTEIARLSNGPQRISEPDGDGSGQ